MRGEIRILGYYINGEPDRARPVLVDEDGLTDLGDQKNEVRVDDVDEFFKKKKATFLTPEEAMSLGLLETKEKKFGKVIMGDSYGRYFSREQMWRRQKGGTQSP